MNVKSAKFRFEKYRNHSQDKLHDINYAREYLCRAKDASNECNDSGLIFYRSLDEVLQAQCDELEKIYKS